MNADLRVGAVEETITVTGQSPTVDVQNVVQQRVMTRDVLDGAPLGTKQAAAVGALIPGVIASSQDVGGTQFTAASISIHGGRSGEMLILFDGLDASNGQGRGGAYTTVQSNDAAVQELALEVSGFSAESEMGGIRTNLIPRDGGNLFKGSFFANGTNSKFQSDNLTDRLKALGANSTNRVLRIYDVNPAFGGPVKKDTLWFFAAARKFQARQAQAGLFYNSSTIAVHLHTRPQPAGLRDDDRRQHQPPSDVAGLAPEQDQHPAPVPRRRPSITTTPGTRRSSLMRRSPTTRTRSTSRRPAGARR